MTEKMTTAEEFIDVLDDYIFDFKVKPPKQGFEPFRSRWDDIKAVVHWLYDHERVPENSVVVTYNDLMTVIEHVSGNNLHDAAYGRLLDVAKAWEDENPQFDEPTEFGSIVEDVNGVLWVRVSNEGRPGSWMRPGNSAPFSWDELPEIVSIDR